MKRKILLLICAGLALAGCVTPTRYGEPVVLTAEQRASLRAFPEGAYEMEQSVVFTLRGRDFAGFGMTRIEADESFASSCVTAQGMTLFEIAGQGERLDLCHTLPGIGDTAKVGAMFAECVRNVYFGNVPSPDAKWHRDYACWVAVSALDNGDNILHCFSIDDGRLLEKHLMTRRGKIVWSATYDDYDEIGPRRIIVHDNTQRYSYKLNLNTTNWRVAGEEP